MDKKVNDRYTLPNALMDELEKQKKRIKELESQLSDGKVAIDIISKLNAMLVVKHGKIFKIDKRYPKGFDYGLGEGVIRGEGVNDKIPSWDWVIEKLDEILSKFNVECEDDNWF